MLIAQDQRVLATIAEVALSQILFLLPLADTVHRFPLLQSGENFLIFLGNPIESFFALEVIQGSTNRRQN